MVTVNLGMLHYVIDHVYGALMHRTKMSTPFFSRGWGCSKLELLVNLVNFVDLSKVFVEILSLSLLVCNVAKQSLVCTGDHAFERRLRLGAPLLKENITTMVLESPFYGKRRPMLQQGAELLCFSDLLLLGRATIEETRSLLHWLDSEAGFSKMGISGLSMGGRHAAMVGSLHPTPVATLPFLSPHSAVVAFCEGILKHGTAWEALREDLAAQKAEITLEEVRERMRNVLSLTDVTPFLVPKNPNAVIFVAATDDGYLPKHSVLELQKAWPGSDVRWVTRGHVSSFLFYSSEFRKAIVDGLDRLEWKESP
ncbi:protein ABHD18-like [Mangifera indica]|uniref:protein ABHD18-like n=1 Tax=Mangifera indica TaxID=29780 RepID=UPI001CFC2FBC|nr:protein ABHD18-like [Mangifera indica]